MKPPLPIDEVLPVLLQELRQASSVVLRAPAGAGKTTRVPPAILDSRLADSRQILMLQPRRIAARSAAARIAFERSEPVGKTAGYQVRFDEQTGPETRIIVMTEGILLRKLLDDPFLDDVAVVIFDEFHERRLDSDLALAMTRRIQSTVRPDLKIVVMSATLDPNPIAAYLDNCPVVESHGRTFPVRIQYSRSADRRSMVDSAVQGVQDVFNADDGDVLVFLPGVGEIHRAMTDLRHWADRHHVSVLPLYGDLSPEEQDQVLKPSNHRRVILSTNVAETSVTIEGITSVVDTGYARQMLFDPAIGLDRLELQPISKASADQRAGRAGRTRPGHCLRLWDEVSHRHRSEYETPELHRVDLSSAVLRLFTWGESDILSFPWYESPPADAVKHAIDLLELLGAIRNHAVTKTGQEMVRAPVAPRLARLLIEGRAFGISRRASLLAAMLSERDPFQRSSVTPQSRPSGRLDKGSMRSSRPIPTVSSRRSCSDVLDRVIALEAWMNRQHNTPDAQSPPGEIQIGAAKVIQQVARQLEQGLTRGPSRNSMSESQQDPAITGKPDPDEALLRALLAAFPDRVTRRREPGSPRGLMVGGRGVQLGAQSAVVEPQLFLSVDIDDKGADATVRQASMILRDWLPASQIRTTEDLFFHPSQKQVVARKRTWFADLCLDETPTAISRTDECAELLFKAAHTQFAAVFPEEDQELNSFLMRVRCLADWMPELNIPRFDQTALDEVLRQLCQNRRSFAELKQAPWLDSLQNSLDWQTRQLIDNEAPERIQVPSGNRIRIVYEEGKPPVLPVRIQEVFGWKQTPRIAGGRIPLLLHLLAPNMRPQQITDDLASFWANTYADVRKELRRRYPKHNWPEL